MARATTNFKRLFLRNLLWRAEQYGETLFDTLKVLAQARLTETQRGKFLVSTAANGHSDTWQVPSGFTPGDAADLCSEMLDRYDEARDALIDGGNASPTDAQVHAEMLDKCTPVRQVHRDYSGLRMTREVV